MAQNLDQTEAWARKQAHNHGVVWAPNKARTRLIRRRLTDAERAGWLAIAEEIRAFREGAGVREPEMIEFEETPLPLMMEE